MRFAAIFGLAASALAVQEPRTITLITTNREIRVAEAVITAEEGVRSGDLRLAITDLVQVEFGRPSDAPRRAPIRVLLRNGDVIFGQIGEGSGAGLRLETDFGRVDLRFEDVKEIVHDAGPGRLSAEEPDASRADRLVQGDGQVDAGILESVSRTGVRFRSEVLAQAVEHPWSQVREIHLTPLGGRNDFNPNEAFASFSLRDGSRLRGNLVRADAREVVLEAQAVSPGVLRIPAERVVWFGFPQRGLVYLSDLEPAAVSEEPFAGGRSWLPRFRRDQSPAFPREPIRISGRAYPKGLGMRSGCRVEYALEGGYRLFRATVGLDDSAGEGGSVNFRVLGDGRVLFESGLLAGPEWRGRLRAKGGPVDVRVDVRGVRRLVLQLEAGPDDDVLDRGGWGDAVLMR